MKKTYLSILFAVILLFPEQVVNAVNTSDVENSSNTSIEQMDSVSSELNSDKMTSETSVQEKSSSTTNRTEETTSDSSSDSENNGESVTITEEMNKPMGAHAKAGTYSRAARSLISADEAGRPTKSFVDVSSWNGSLSQNDYSILKRYGVTGVVVKMTEGTTYTNPERFSQIQNAQAQGLKVSVFHYSHFTTENGAIAEANYFADRAIEMGLSKETIMVNDAEEPGMNNGKITANSVAFARQLNVRGFSNVTHYSMGSWFTPSILDISVLGAGNIWIANYPNNPTINDELYRSWGVAAWQWSSELVFPGVTSGIGRFDISQDYTGRFSSGKIYDTILEEKKYQYAAKVLPELQSKVHGVYDGINNTKPGISRLGMGHQFANQKVRVTGLARTNRSTYLKFTLNGKTMWMDKRAFTPDLDTVSVESTKLSLYVRPEAEAKKHGLYTQPNNTSTENEILGLGSLYANQAVEVTNIGKISTGITAYQFSIDGTTIGWMDSRAFIGYDTILEEKKYQYAAKVLPELQSKVHGVYDGINNTKPGISRLGMGHQFANQKVRVTGLARTNRSTYLKFTLNGKIMWMDKRAFTPDLDTVSVESTKLSLYVRPEAEAKKHGLYTQPNNTSTENEILGLGSLYANQAVEVTNIGKISTGITAYQFSIDGTTIGWMDSRAFIGYDTILEEKKYQYAAKVLPELQSKVHGVYDGINNTKPGISRLGMGHQFANQKVRVTGLAKTNRSTYLKFTLNGKTMWMDKRAFTPDLDTVNIKPTKLSLYVRPEVEAKKHGLYTHPNNTSTENEVLGLGALYANQAVEVINIGKISTGITAYQFSIDGTTIGWMDSRAFIGYDTILEEKKYQYAAKVLPELQSKVHGVYDGINNTKPGISRLGMGHQFANQKVRVTGLAKTNRSTYLKFTLNGKTMWMDKRAFTPDLDTVSMESIKLSLYVRPEAEAKKHGLYTHPNNTSTENELLGMGSLYADKAVEVTNIGKISTGITAYQFSINGTTIGWMDSRAFEQR